MKEASEMKATRFTIAMALAALVSATAFAQTPGSGQGGGNGQKNKTGAAATPAKVGGQIACPAQQELIKTPELISSNGRLRATITVESEKQRLAFRYPAGSRPGDAGTFNACYEQWVRAFRTPDAAPAYAAAPAPGTYRDPMAGPTLRAKVGDVIEIAFLNRIDPANFGDSIDRGDYGDGDCDQSGPSGSIYPKGVNDQYPNCFHGSSSANLHFHGTHTNPNTTGDNVFVEVISSKRLKDEPPLDAATVRKAFDPWFDQCEAELLKGTHVEYPRSWTDLPKDYTKDQQRLLEDKYDKLPGIGKKLWPVDEKQLLQGAWPQYYLGTYPYCFRLPNAPAPTTTTTATKSDTPHTHGAGTAELGSATDFNHVAETPLRMGQAPGTHWYHAHKHGSTTIDVNNGMTGAFIIEGDYDVTISKNYDPTAPAGSVAWTRKQPVMVINQIDVSPNIVLGGAPPGQDKGADFSINGRLNPLLTMAPGEVKMLRLINSSSRSGIYFSGPPSGFHWKQIAIDGVQFDQYNWDHRNNDGSFTIAAGNRADLLFQAPAAACANTKGCPSTVMVYNVVDPTDVTGKNPVLPVPLFTANVKGAVMNPAMTIMQTAPDMPDFLKDIPDADVKVHRTMEFASTKPTTAQHTIDGHQFSGEVGAVVLLNTVEEWKILNATSGPNISHPFHIHINPFQIPEVFSPNELLADGKTAKYVTTLPAAAGQCYLNPDDDSTWRPQNYNTDTKKCDYVVQPKNQKHMIWWDVFPIPSGITGKKADGTSVIIPGYFTMRSRFVDFAGYYVLHCHILAHEDRGMMTVVEVAPFISPYSHH
jgi:FtsP/CotA-like multicopper oxidase with cupredoxin domain